MPPRLSPSPTPLRHAGFLLHAAAGWLLALLAGAAPLAAGDWPQILGPNRNGRAEGEPLHPWPEEGLAEAWKYSVGTGFAGAVCVKDRVVVFHRLGGEERIEALELEGGRPLWSRNFEASYRPGINPDDGPRCVPLVHGDQVFAFGAAGDLYCVNLETGARLWTRALYADYRGDEGYFGAGSSPILLGDRLLVDVGGRDGAGLVALSLDSGRTLWRGTDEGASYSSPIAANVQGTPAALFITRLSALAVDPRDGALLFRLPFGKRGPTVNAAIPLLVENKLFLTASYGIGAQCLELPAAGRPGVGEPREVWANDESLSSQYNTPVHHGGFLYGIHGREDVAGAELRCVELATGRVRWTVPEYGVAHLIGSGDRLLILQLNGRLVLAAANPAKYEPLAETQLPGEVYRALPALAHGRLLLRSTAGRGDHLRCLELPSLQADDSNR